MNLNDFDCVVFDVDKTIADSGKKITDTMLEKLVALARHKPIALVSTRGLREGLTSFVERFHHSLKEHEIKHIQGLYVFPTTAATGWEYDSSTGKLEPLYNKAKEDRAFQEFHKTFERNLDAQHIQISSAVKCAPDKREVQIRDRQQQVTLVFSNRDLRDRYQDYLSHNNVNSVHYGTRGLHVLPEVDKAESVIYLQSRGYKRFLVFADSFYFDPKHDRIGNDCCFQGFSREEAICISVGRDLPGASNNMYYTADREAFGWQLTSYLVSELLAGKDFDALDLYPMLPYATEGKCFAEDFKPLSAEQISQYLNRIGVKSRKSIPINLRTLSTIHRNQVEHIDVSNFQMHDVKSQRDIVPVSLNIEDIFRKIVIDGQEGYCFENNLLLAYVLKSIGFDVDIHNGHIIREGIAKSDPQHIVVRVKLNGHDYLLDAGYGGSVPIPMLDMTETGVQHGIGQPWRYNHVLGDRYQLTDVVFNGVPMKQVSQYFKLSADGKGQLRSWKPLYQFPLQSSSMREICEANYRVCRNRHTSPFSSRVFKTHFGDQGTRTALTTDELNITQYGRLLHWQPIHSKTDFKQALQTRFCSEAPEFTEQIQFR